MKTIRLLLVEDLALVRAGIRALLEKEEAVIVVGEVGNGHEALGLIENLRPHVLLLDLKRSSGFEFLKTTSEKFPRVQVILFAQHDEKEYALQALRAGAAAYLPKSAASAELGLAIANVMAGGKYLSPACESKTACEFRRNTPQASDHLSQLTPRQQEILTLIALGHSTKDTAIVLNISAKTVETHRAQLMDRLDIHDLASLVKYAIRTGLVSIEEH